MKIKDTAFSLQKFGQENALHNFNITGRIRRDSRTLSILYELSGFLNKLADLNPSEKPSRTDRLWEGTCFELFLNPQNSDAYWEFNLSPSGGWNVYRFDAYRQGMQEEGAFADLPFSVRKESQSLRLALEFNAEKIIPQDHAINVAVCAVLKSVSGRKSYWALTHQGRTPDFHRKDGFIIEL